MNIHNIPMARPAVQRQLLGDIVPPAEPRKPGAVETASVDADEMRHFFRAVFKNCPRSGYVAIRAFPHNGETWRPVVARWAPFDEALETAIAVAADVATMREPSAVFSPPVCSFDGPIVDGRRRAREEDVAFCPVILVELDERPVEALATLTEILGPPTITVASGGVWEGQDKLHVYWRLSAPASTAEALAELKEARRMAAELVQADRTAVTVVHPIRWPGSLHTKDPAAPRVCRIVNLHDRDVELRPALAALRAATVERGISPRDSAVRQDREGFKAAEPMTAEQLLAVADAMRNDDLPWDAWNSRMMAFFDASHGNEDGREAAMAWSLKSDKCEPDDVDARWDHFGHHPPTQISGGSLVYHARQDSPGFTLGAPVDATRWLDREADNVLLFPAVGESAQRLAHAKPMVAVREQPDAKTIPTRKWLIEPRYPIGDVTQIVGEPGISKSSFAILDALVVASGDERLLRGGARTGPERLHRNGPVVIYNAEDSTEEMRRRLTAGMRHYDIPKLAHPIHLWSGVDGEGLTIMERREGGGRELVKRAGGADLLVQRLRDTGAVLAFLDPQVSLSRGLEENDTGDMNALLQELATIAAGVQVAIAVIHHTAKRTRDAAGDMGAGRGSFAVAGKVRSMLTLTNIAAADAEAWGVDAETHVRLDYAKSSHGRMPKSPLLLKRHDVSVGNGAGETGATVSMFEETPAEMLRRHGDRAPVIEVIGPARASASGPGTSDAERRASEATSIARAALAAMAGETPVRIADIRAHLVKTVNDAGISHAKTPSLITSIVKSALCRDGVQLDHDGQAVRVRAFQDGRGPKAPWFLEVAEPTDKLSGQGDESDERLASSGAFS